ncbi:hypothetical protein SUGI_0084880 [Cryptomeria japonica]|nr:hypothetical protein SUGI_0084880 [Cryptomeria japonica]
MQEILIWNVLKLCAFALFNDEFSLVEGSKVFTGFFSLTGRSSGVVGVESKSSVFSSLNSSAISRFEPVTKVQTLEFKIFFHILAGKR